MHHPRKLRLGYIWANYHEQVIETLISSIFQYHNRSKFEIYGYSLVDADDEFTEQMRSGCDVFTNLAQMSSVDAAQCIHSDRINILIDLGGYTSLNRPEILALQPAPIQVQYLGDTSTMKSEFIQYILADSWLISDDLAADYSQKIIELRHAFVASPLAITPQLKSLRDFGLPSSTLRFCCFNRSDKFDLQVFASWMRILQQVPKSVLWLIESNPEMNDTLCHLAQQQGITPERLVFTPHLPLAEYQAAYSWADIFLDTFVANTGAIAIHALLAGTPIITCLGTTFVSRMGASICAAMGLQDALVGDTAIAYEQKAVYLATEPNELPIMRRILASHRHNLPLFQPQQWIADLEAALWQVWQRS
ncbi:TPR domain protein [Calothrix brevissima NIES-22]|nr:TPR domain protein [Calothrix brevissima NIES-22]